MRRRRRALHVASRRVVRNESTQHLGIHCRRVDLWGCDDERNGYSLILVCACVRGMGVSLILAKRSLSTDVDVDEGWSSTTKARAQGWCLWMVDERIDLLNTVDCHSRSPNVSCAWGMNKHQHTCGFAPVE